MLLSADAPPFELFEQILTQQEAAEKPQMLSRSDVIVDDNLGFAKVRPGCGHLVPWAGLPGGNSGEVIIRCDTKPTKVSCVGYGTNDSGHAYRCCPRRSPGPCHQVTWH